MNAGAAHKHGLGFMIASCRKKKGGRPRASSPAGRPPGDLVSRNDNRVPVSACRTGLPVARESHLLLGQFSQDRYAVLNAQTLNFAVPQVAAEADEFLPRRRQPRVAFPC